MLQDWIVSAEQSVFAVHPIHTFGVAELQYGKAALVQSVLEVHFVAATQILGDAVLQVDVPDAQSPLAVQAAHFLVVILHEGTVSPVQSLLVAHATQTLLLDPLQ